MTQKKRINLCPFCRFPLKGKDRKVGHCKSCHKVEYLSMIKKECVVCGEAIPATLKHYLIYGNLCLNCSANAERLWKGRAGISTTKNKIEKVRKKLKRKSLSIRERRLLKTEFSLLRKDVRDRVGDLKRLISTLPRYIEIEL